MMARDGEKCERSDGWPCTQGSCACRYEMGVVRRKDGEMEE